MRAEGFAAKDPINEDWGWIVPVSHEPFELWVGCANLETETMRCFIEPDTPYVRRWLKKLDTRQDVERLRRTLDKMLASHPGVSDLRWTGRST